MPLGTNRIRDMVPTDCNGRWGYAVNQVFGWTLWDPPGGAFTLEEIRVWITDPATGVAAEEVVHDGAAFQGLWVAGSAYNAGTGVTTVFRVGGYLQGTLLRFRVRSTDGANSAFSSFLVGIQDPPGTSTVPAVGQVVRSIHDGELWELTEIVGAAGSVRYRVRARDRTKAGEMLLSPNDFIVFPPRERLDDRILLSE